jgi:hypothetical protein
MSEKTPRTEMDEIEAAFAIINLQSDNLGKPIYLVHGIDKEKHHHFCQPWHSIRFSGQL